MLLGNSTAEAFPARTAAFFHLLPTVYKSLHECTKLKVSCPHPVLPPALPCSVQSPFRGCCPPPVHPFALYTLYRPPSLYAFHPPSTATLPGNPAPPHPPHTCPSIVCLIPVLFQLCTDLACTTKLSGSVCLQNFPTV